MTTRRAMAQLAADNLIAYLGGKAAVTPVNTLSAATARRAAQ